MDAESAVERASATHTTHTPVGVDSSDGRGVAVAKSKVSSTRPSDSGRTTKDSLTSSLLRKWVERVGVWVWGVEGGPNSGSVIVSKKKKKKKKKAVV